MNIRDLQTTLQQRDLDPSAQNSSGRQQAFFKLIEEVGELAAALRIGARYQPDEPSIKGSLDEELSDVLYSLLLLANRYEVDMEQAITRKEQISQLRPSALATMIQDQPTGTHHAPRTTTQETPMSSTSDFDLKSIAQRFIDELWNQRNLAVADELFAENCVTNQLRSGANPTTSPRTPATVKKQVGDWIAAFPDFHYTVRQMMSDGDRVMTQCVASGTHQGNWLGIPATGKTVAIETMIIQRIADGKIVEDWVLTDFLGLFQQLGLIPSLQELLAARKN